MKICPGCNRLLDETDFNFKNRERGTRQVRCRSCTRLQVKQHYDANSQYYADKAIRRRLRLKDEQRRRVLHYLSEHPCVDCGEADPVCLDFDHVNGNKVDNVSNMLGDYAWSRIEAEIAKCEVRCANCHRKKTARQYGFWGAAEQDKNMRP